MMNEFTSVSFKDHPAISSEYVKFLVSDTGFEKVERIEKLLRELKEISRNVEKIAQEANKSSNTMGNKAKEAYELMANLSKRMVKVGAKV
mmetsp:Transcript_58127/g.69339  ORF Transcript_58127/g.69339 Transcript_58127/m.69339 type:complete len:90 (+) Transcript_58127:671-940(+)